MIRTQIQISPEQARALKRLSVKHGKSVAELIRMSIEALLDSGGVQNQDEIRRRAMAAAGRFNCPADLSVNHDKYLDEAFDQ